MESLSRVEYLKCKIINQELTSVLSMKIEQLTKTLYVTECILDHMVARDAYGFPLSVYEKNSTDCN